LVRFRWVQKYFKYAPIRVRLHILIRSLFFDFSLIEPYVKESGRFLDIGCGYGAWALTMASLKPDSRVIGIDPDASKILVGNEAIQNLGLGNIELCVSSAQSLDWDDLRLITIIDVLYLLPYSDQEIILSNAFKNLDSGGRLLLKEMSQNPRWKFIWNWIEEYIAVKIIKITSGDRFYFRKAEEWQMVLSSLGFRVNTIRMDKGDLHPHILFIGEKN